MTADGEFITPHAPPPPAGGLWAVKLGIGAVILAAIAGAVVVTALVVWVASVMIPVALVAGLVAYGAFRFQTWRAQRTGRP
jgi:hypothetical protein